MNISNSVKAATQSITKSSPKKIDVRSLTDEQKEIFLKYLKYDLQLAFSNAHRSLCTLMVIELNRTNVTHTKDIWLRLLKSWMNSIKSNSVAHSSCDKTLKRMLDDEFVSVKPSTYQLSCILDHLTEPNAPNVWERISNELSSGSESKSDVYWKNLFAAAKARTLLKVQLLESLRSNKIEITDDLQMTETENRILEHEKSISQHEHVNDSEDQCRVCLAYGTAFLNLFNEKNETPSMIEKLMECSRISEISEDDGFPQSICESCVGQLEIAYQFRILSEVSEHKLKNKITIVDDATVVEVDLIEECDDGQSIGDSSQVGIQMDENDAFLIWEETNPKTEIADHQDVILHQCDTCGITFDTLKLLKKHIRCIHVVAPVSSRECKLCSKVFKSEALLRAHGRTHSDLRPYICETCGKCFKTTSQLASHCLTHSDVKNFECPNCSYRGDTNNNLRIHLRTHTRVQPYSCRFCQFKFSTASNMQKHIRNIHHKMRTHQCNECSKSFFAKESLRKHMVTHTGIKLYSCSICAASYAWYNGLKKHMRIQHAGEKCPSEITFRPTKSMC